MPVKRSRISTSSSFGEIGVLSPPLESADGWTETRVDPPYTSIARLPSNTAKAMKSTVAEKKSEPRSGILVLSSVEESVDSSDKETIGGFLDRCYYCKKKILENAQVFMYSYLRAFCTVECRDRQMAMDNEMEKDFVKSKGMQLSHSG